MTITTYLDENIRLFKKMKKQTSGSWEFLLSGEWSETPYHQGNVRFYYRASEDRCNWAILTEGFPKRIVVAATFDQPTGLEDACAIMLKTLKRKGGECVDLVDDSRDFDEERFWEAYRTKS